MRVLIVTSKWAVIEQEIDGGCMTACNVLEAISSKSVVDILLSDKYKNIEINGINKYFYYSTDEDIIKNYNGDNKFLCRIKISRLVASILYKIHGLYDKIIIIHTFHAFEICKTIEKKVLDKIILFPMLLTPSYLKSGENIPKIYVNYEKKTLRSVFKIITPSIFECNQIRTIYKIEPHRVVCIPRYVSSQFNFSSHIIEFNKPIKICYVASIKKQKQNIKALELLKLLLKQGLNAHLYLVGAIHDFSEYLKILTYIDNNYLRENVTILQQLSQKKVNELFSQTLINISVSRCETFGRSIIEGLYTGLPAFVLKSAECFESLVGDCNGIEYFDNIEDMASRIKFLYGNINYYKELCEQALFFAAQFSESNIKPLLQKEILCQI